MKAPQRYPHCALNHLLLLSALVFRDPGGNVTPSVVLMMLSLAHVNVPGHGVPGPLASLQAGAALLVVLECCRFLSAWSWRPGGAKTYSCSQCTAFA